MQELKKKFGYILEGDENEEDSNYSKYDNDNSEDFDADIINVLFLKYIIIFIFINIKLEGI